MMIVTSVAPAAPLEPRIGVGRIQYAQLTIRQRLTIIRIPTRADPPKIRWKEKRAPRCIPMDGIRAAAVSGMTSVDIVFKGGDRVRAKLESDCPALDYYSGFYIAPTKDNRICADRDAIHARSGGECRITRFRSLVPDR